MSRIPKRFTALAVVLILINVAGLAWIRYELTQQPARGIRVLSALPEEERVDGADRFALVFDEPWVPESRVGEPLKTAPFRLEPDVGGQWRWASRRRLVHQIEEKLPPGRRFRIRPVANFRQETGRRLVGPETFTFKTAPLKLTGCALERADRDRVRFALRFNQPVAASELEGAMKVFVSPIGEGLDPERLSEPTAEAHKFRFERPEADRVHVRLAGELKGADADLPLGETVHRALELPERFSLTGADPEHPGTESSLSVDLDFSRRLASDQSSPEITVRPSVQELTKRVSPWGLVLRGKFKPHREYTVTIGPTLEAHDGTTLGRKQRTRFTIPDRSASLDFAQSRGVLSPHGNLELALEAVNVPALRFEAIRVHDNNLVHHLRGASPSRTSRPVARRTVAVEAKRNEVHETLIDLRDLLGKEPRGLYRIDARSSATRWRDDRALVAVTDLAITAKQHAEGLTAWVTGLHSAEPVAGATIRVRSATNQVLAEGSTDERGLARLELPQNHPDGRPWLITAQKGDDLSYLRLDRGQWHRDGVDADGAPWPEAHQALLYTERGVYRPGRRIHGTGILRTDEGKVPPPFPLEIHVHRPDGKEVATRTVQPGEHGQGVFHFDYTPPEDAQMGRYKITATLPGASAKLGKTSALVEAFVPARIELSARAARERYRPGEKAHVSLQARYLFDEPASGLPAKVTGELRWRRYSPEGFEDFTFAGPPRKRVRELEKREAELDAEGRAATELALPDDLPPGLWRGRGVATVHEAGGRSISRRLRFEVEAGPPHLGLALPAGRERVTADRAVPLRWAQVRAGKLAEAPKPVKLTLARVERDHVLASVDGEKVWRTRKHTRRLETRKLARGDQAEARGELEIRCPEPGWYRATLTAPKSGRSTRLDFYAGAQATESTQPIGDPTGVELELDRETHRPGEKARVTVRAPFAGRLLVTVESDRVVARRVARMKKNVRRLEIPLPESLRGTAFVTASVVRPIDPEKKSWRPHRAYGMKRIELTREAHRLPVAIDAPSSARPGESTRVTVRVGAAAGRKAADAGAKDRPPPDTRPAETTRPASADTAPAVVHLWAVDEGILLPSAYEVPDPVGHFLAERRLGVTSRDIFGRLLPDHERPAEMARIGAGPDEDGARSLRRNPVTVERRDPAVIWRRAVPVKSRGRVSVDLEMPRFQGEMRVMAVAVRGDEYGAAEAPVTVNAPVMAKASWPRFAAPGDRFRVPVKLFNETSREKRLRVAAHAKGPLELGKEALEQPLTVEPDATRTVWLAAEATEPGAVRARISVREAGKEKASPLVERASAFPVRRAAPLETSVRFLEREAGETLEIEGAEDLRAGASRRRVTVRGSPAVELQPGLRALVAYPHGCAEQTTSRLWAMLRAPDLLAESGLEDATAGSAERYVRAGLDRLRSMQTTSGGIAYWPGGTRAHPWATGYVARFLAEARRAGHEIEPGFHEPLLDDLAERVRDTTDEAPSDDARALYCRVLAAFDRPATGWMATLAGRVKQLDMAGRAHLAGAFHAIGRRDRALACLAEGTLRQAGPRTTGGRITGESRQLGVLLSVLLEIDPDHRWVPKLVRRLKRRRENGAWPSTLANASALAALAKYQQRRGQRASFTGALVAPHRDRRIPVESSARRSLEIGDATKPLRLETEGEGTAYVTVRSEGRPKDGAFERYDRGLEVRRRWLDRAGEEIDPSSIEVGDLIRVAVTVKAPELNDGETLHNVAIVDALPGGVEVENPRLATSATFGEDSADPAHVQFRDDRVLLYTDIGLEARTFRYAVRAVTPGRFQGPPIQASCMYDPAFASVAGGGEIRILLRRD